MEHYTIYMNNITPQACWEFYDFSMLDQIVHTQKSYLIACPLSHKIPL